MKPDLFSAFPLRSGRVHEAGGPGAPAFAAICAAGMPREVLWIRPAWLPETLNPLGVSAFFDPSRLLVAQVRDHVDGLATMEEALRDGALSFVAMDLTKPLDLTAGRRLQLAARAGQATGLCLIPEGMGSNAAETRWHCAPVCDPGTAALQHWQLAKNKSGTTGSWHVRWDEAARRLVVASPPPTSC